ncbi:unnamed protein product [Merluccius merluccius]
MLLPVAIAGPTLLSTAGPTPLTAIQMLAATGLTPLPTGQIPAADAGPRPPLASPTSRELSSSSHDVPAVSRWSPTWPRYNWRCCTTDGGQRGPALLWF